MNRTIRYTLGAAFYDDHVSRDCRAGTLVKRSARTVTVELDVIDWLDLRSDAEYYANPATARDMAECGDGFGRAMARSRSAAATIGKLDADPFTADEQAAGRAAWDAEQAAEREAGAAALAELRERLAAERVAREADAAAHPKVPVAYEGRRHAAPGIVAGVDGEHLPSLIVGARLATSSGYVELVELGELRRGTVEAFGRYTDGEPVGVLVELCGRYLPADYAGPVAA